MHTGYEMLKARDRRHGQYCKWLVLSLASFVLILTTFVDALGGPLHDAAKKGSRDEVQKLILLGHDVNELDPDGHTPLLVAFAWNNLNIAELLLESEVDINYKDPGGFDAIYRSVTRYNIDLLVKLLSLGASPNNRYFPLKRSLLHIASAYDWVDGLEVLLSRKDVDVNSRDALGRTPLHVATNWLSPKCVKTLLSHGAAIDARDNQGLAPIHGVDVAPGGGAPTELLKILINSGANVNARDSWGVSPLHIHAYHPIYEGHLILAQYLLSSGADVNIRDSCGITPLHTASNQGTSEALPFLEMLIASGAKINGRDNFRLTPLHHAASEANVSIAKYLIEKKADVNSKDMLGDTPLHHSAQIQYWFNWDNPPRFLIDMVRTLIAAGADTESKNRYGFTPLHRAAYWGHSAVAQILLENGADPNLRDINGNTPMHHAAFGRQKARSTGCLRVIDLLMAKGGDIQAKNSSGQTIIHFLYGCDDSSAVELAKTIGVFLNEKDVFGMAPHAYSADPSKLQIKGATQRATVCALARLWPGTLRQSFSMPTDRIDLGWPCE